MATLSPAVELTRNLIGFDTRNPGSDETACTEYLQQFLEQQGFQVTKLCFQPNRPSLIARLGKGKRPALCFAGHIDTVPLGKNSWSHDPFGGNICNGKLFGRGAADMKGGIASMIIAACNIKKKLLPDDDIILIIAAGEESGCQGSYHIAEHPELMGRAGALVVTEPTCNYPLIGHKGALWLNITFRGKTAHGAMPHKGVNAVIKSAEAVLRLNAFSFDTTSHPLMGPPTVNIGYHHGGINMNSVPDRAEIGVDIRTVPGMNNDKIIYDIESLLPSAASVEPLVNVPPLWIEPTTPWIQEVFSVSAEISGETITPKTVNFFTDGPPLHMAYGRVPTIILGPGDPTMAHQTDEFTPVKEIDQAVVMYEKIAENWYRV